MSTTSRVRRHVYSDGGCSVEISKYRTKQDTDLLTEVTYASRNLSGQSKKLRVS